MGKLLILSTLLMAGSLGAGAQSLQHHESGYLQAESCRDHVASTRHWLRDAAKVSSVGWERTWLRKAYKTSLRPETVAAVCVDRRTMAQYDLDLSDIRLQMAYDLQRRAELKLAVRKSQDD